MITFGGIIIEDGRDRKTRDTLRRIVKQVFGYGKTTTEVSIRSLRFNNSERAKSTMALFKSKPIELPKEDKKAELLKQLEELDKPEAQDNKTLKEIHWFCEKTYRTGTILIVIGLLNLATIGVIVLWLLLG